MSQVGFYNDNANRSYPLQSIDAVRGEYAQSSLLNPALLPDSVMVDFGCVFGLGAGFVHGQHTVWVNSYSRSGTTISIEFRTDATALSGYALIFRRDITDEEFSHEFAECELVDSSSSASAEYNCPVAPMWEGFLITGDLSDLLDILTGDMTITVDDSSDMVIEQALIQNLDQTYIQSFNLANTPREYSPISDECSSLSSVADGDTDIIVNARCIQGAVKLKEGYNCEIRQNQTLGTITIAASKGGGEGEPCEETPLYEGEEPKAGSRLLSGGPACNELITSINGAIGPDITVKGTRGIKLIRSETDPNRLVIDINFEGLRYCPVEVSSSESSSSSAPL